MTEFVDIDDLESRIDQCKSSIHSLKQRNSALKKENEGLKAELEAVRSEMGSKLFKERGGFADLIKTVEQLQVSLDKKTATKHAAFGGNKPVRMVVSDVPTSPSQKLAEELLTGAGILSVGGEHERPETI